VPIHPPPTFHLEEVVFEQHDKIITFLKELLDLDEKERGYLESFKNGLYESLLLFNDLTCLNANKQPMAKWKIQNILSKKNK